MGHLFNCHDVEKTDMVTGSGCYLFDKSGKRFIDFEAGVWCLALGYNHPAVNQTIYQEGRQLMHIGYRYTPEHIEETAQALAEVAGIPDAKSTFLNSGSEAVEFAATIIRKINPHKKLLTLKGSYLSAYGTTGCQPSEDVFQFDWQTCLNCNKNEQCNQNCRIVQDIPFQDIGGFIFEPGNAHGLIRIPPVGLIKVLSDRIKDIGGLIAVNEVTTGFGRTAKWCGHHHYQLNPDVISFGKCLGNGYPVSAVVIRREFAEAIEKTGFRYAQSHQNDPLGCAVALTVIRTIQAENLMEKARESGRYLLDRLKNLASDFSVIKEARGRGLMTGLEFNPLPDRITMTNIYHQLLDAGVLVGVSPGPRFMRFYPSMMISGDDIDALMEALYQVIGAIR